MENEGLALVLDGRTYGEGGGQHLKKLKEMTVPSELDALSTELIGRSALITLPPESESSAIYDAYGADVLLMERYRGAFKRTIDAAVHARADADEQVAQTFLDRMAKEISEIVHQPTLDLAGEALELESAALLTQLQQQFRDDVESLKQGIAVWLHVLAEGGYVSVIDWFGDKALRYHFFRVESERKGDSRSRVVHDPGILLRGRYRIEEVEVNIDIFGERRTHTLVNAETHRPRSYRHKVPERIARLLDNIPQEIQPFVSIIDGKVSEEQVARRLASSQVETETRKVWVPDPAIALFNTWAMGGWGGSMVEPVQSIYRGHPNERANRVLAWSLIGTVVAAVAVMPLGGARATIMVGILGLILTFFGQLWMQAGNDS